jgi:hypothetical protein
MRLLNQLEIVGGGASKACEKGIVNVQHVTA